MPQVAIRDIHVPLPLPIVPVEDQEMVDYVGQLGQEEEVTIELDPEQCMDIYYDQARKVFVSGVKLLDINGVPWRLQPGINKVPVSVRTFWLDCQDQAVESENDNKRLRKMQLLSRP